MAHKISKECNLDFERIWSSGQQSTVHNTDDENDEDEIQEIIR